MFEECLLRLSWLDCSLSWKAHLHTGAPQETLESESDSNVSWDVISLKRHIFTQASYFHSSAIFSLKRRRPFLIPGGGSRLPWTPPFASAFGDTDGQVRRPNLFFNHLIDAAKQKAASIKWEVRIDQVRINQGFFLII